MCETPPLDIVESYFVCVGFIAKLPHIRSHELNGFKVLVLFLNGGCLDTFTCAPGNPKASHLEIAEISSPNLLRRVTFNLPRNIGE
ncbi:uncharacterized protein ARMOST_14370 [Armillaria ostoyae]|uniref:Uncharacterized protein n=1 Tax=Armillaria ostoyae TaxID=47428 RepID=A0A284RQE7_ARMOS|nr:uncharacterized protein ARMOST_14370 [Armillaria ostoyae]